MEVVCVKLSGSKVSGGANGGCNYFGDGVIDGVVQRQIRVIAMMLYEMQHSYSHLRGHVLLRLTLIKQVDN